MFLENRKLSASDNVGSSMSIGGGEGTMIRVDGWYQDRIIHRDGREEMLEGHNLVVSALLTLVQALLKGQTGYSGIKFWAVGSGNDSWDSSAPSPDVSDTALVNEIGRVEIDPDSITYLNADLTESSTPTNIIKIVRLFGENECNGKWREFGLFGGNATTALNSGVMVDHRIHGVITKTTDISIQRTLRLTLNLS